MDPVECAPKCLLGWPIKSKTQIWFNWIVPIVLELLVYVVVIVADFAVTYQHFVDGNHLWAGLTLGFIWLPALLSFITVIATPRNWPDYVEGGEGLGHRCLQFLLIVLVNVLLFPFGAMARFGRRLFWSVEALFHHKDSYERYQSLSKAGENSAFELYHFLQAFTQSAPQLLLQLFILLREDIFRNYETTTVQAISVVFSLFQMAIIAESYQRFESQRIVGRNYPWHPEELCQERRALLERKTMAATIPYSPGKPSPPTQQSTATLTRPAITEFPETRRRWSDDQLERDFWPPQDGDTTTAKAEFARKTLHVDDNNLDVQDKASHRKSSLDSIMAHKGAGDAGIYDIEIDDQPEPISGQRGSGEKNTLEADGDKIKFLWPQDTEPKAINVDDTPMMGQQQLSERKPRRRPSHLADGPTRNEVKVSPDNAVIDYDGFDTSPSSPPPALPILSQVNKILSYPLNRMSTIADMFLLDTELYVKGHVPRLPEKIAKHEFKSHHLASTETRGGRPDSMGPFDATLIAAHKQHDDTGENSMAINVPWPRERSLAATQQPIHDDRHDLVGQDTVDGNVLMMPRRRKMVVGLEQEDFFAKTVGFLGWTFFILARVLSISVFALLHWREAIYICLGHYAACLIGLLWEAKGESKLQRLVFYLFLSYVYVFVIIEFKIKFVHLRVWYGAYVGLVFTQNFLLSVWWYTTVMDFELWWFDYLFRTILGSGVLSLGCLLVYFVRLKPKDKVLFELMEESDQDQQQEP